MSIHWDDLFTAASDGLTAAGQAVTQVMEDQIRRDIEDLGRKFFNQAIGTTKFNNLLPSLWAIHGDHFTTWDFHVTVRDRARSILESLVKQAVAANHPALQNPDAPESLLIGIPRAALTQIMLDYLDDRGLLNRDLWKGA